MTEIEMLQKLMDNMEAMKNNMEAMNKRLDRLENKVDTVSLKSDMTHKKLNDLSLDVQLSERNVRRDIKDLQDTLETVTVILEGKGILPKAM